MVECMTKPPLSDFSVFDMERPSGRFCKFRIVRYDDHCLLQLLMQLEEDIFDRFTGFRIQVPGGLVAEDHLWLIDERTSDGCALLLAAGELRGKMAEPVT